MATAQIIPEGHVPAIYPAMQEVMKGIGNIPKNGVMKFGNTSYSYLRADDVQDAINPLLSENNIVVASTYTTSTDKRGNRDYIYVHLELQYISSLDGSKFPPVQAIGEAIAGDDKSINKSLTQAIKNAHRATFQFTSGEADSDDAPTTAPKKTPAQAKLEQATSKKAPAKPSAKAPAKGNPAAELKALKEKIRDEFVAPGTVKNEEIRGLAAELKEKEGFESELELFQAVYKRLKA